jgi:hypothetical protein
MANVPGYRSRVAVGDFSFSAYITDVSMPFTVNMLDTTTMGDTPGNPGQKAKTFIPGQNTSTLALKGYLDPDGTSGLLYDQINTWTGLEPVTYAPNGFAFGNETILVNALQSGSSTGATTTTPVAFSLDAQSSSATRQGASLHDLTAETADVSSAANDGGASSANGAVANLHVTAYSGLTNAVFIIEDSATGSSGWATIGTFATVSALTSEHLQIAGTVRRYVRCSVDVTGTGSITYVCAIARK